MIATARGVPAPRPSGLQWPDRAAAHNAAVWSAPTRTRSRKESATPAGTARRAPASPARPPAPPSPPAALPARTSPKTAAGRVPAVRRGFLRGQLAQHVAADRIREKRIAGAPEDRDEPRQ